MRLGGARGFTWVLGGVLVALAGACGSTDDKALFGSGGLSRDSGAVDCQRDSDCAAGLRCESGVCTGATGDGGGSSGGITGAGGDVSGSGGDAAGGSSSTGGAQSTGGDLNPDSGAGGMGGDDGSGGAANSGGSSSGGSGGDSSGGAGGGDSSGGSGGISSGGSGGDSSGGWGGWGGWGGSGGTNTGGSGGFHTGGTGGGDCTDLRARMLELLAIAQACEPDSDEACAGSVDGECCDVVVNDPDSEETEKYLDALEELQKRPACLSICPAVLCPAPGAGVCAESNGSERERGRCRSTFGFPIPPDG